MKNYYIEAHQSKYLFQVCLNIPLPKKFIGVCKKKHLVYKKKPPYFLKIFNNYYIWRKVRISVTILRHIFITHQIFFKYYLKIRTHILLRIGIRTEREKKSKGRKTGRKERTKCGRRENNGSDSCPILCSQILMLQKCNKHKRTKKDAHELLGKMIMPDEKSKQIFKRHKFQVFWQNKI